MTGKTAASESPSQKTRALALDALRGIAILAMLLSGQLPFDEHALPSWMYHAQVPPPAFQFNPHLPGITWVDLVFPFFLFSMGAAFPLAFSRRMEQGMPKWRLAAFVLERGVMLGFFALYVQAIRPHVLSSHPDFRAQLAGLLGFLLLFPVLTRLPEAWPPKVRWSIRAAGWIGVISFLACSRYPDGGGFQLGRSDIIIIVLANTAVFGSLAWMLTRNNLLARLGIIGVLLALRLTNMPEQLGGWTSDFWNFSPAPWIYRLYYLQYLCIVIPGTVAGDLMLGWIRESSGSTSGSNPTGNWSRGRMIGVALLAAVFVPVLVVGLKARWLIGTTLTTCALCGIGCLLVSKPANPGECLYQKLFLWAVYWLVLGLCFEPFEGGIRKDKATISYYFVTSGLANCMLICLSIATDFFKRRKWLQLFIDNGQNPMIAYAGINNFITPVLALLGMNVLLAKFAVTPWRGFLSGLFITLLMALTVSVLTRLRVFWRT